MIIGVRTWALVAGASCVLASFLGTTIARWESAPEPCRPFIQLLEGGSWHRCDPGSTMETTIIGEHVLVKCNCPTASNP